MALLGAISYDPTVAAAVGCASAAAMVAFDTTNCRLTFTAPSSGRVMVRVGVCGTGSTSQPKVLLGAMSGATVVGRAYPKISHTGATGSSGTWGSNDVFIYEALFAVTGLTGGSSYTWDAAFEVQTTAASATLTWGGPNNASASNAFGPLQFEIYG